MVASFVAKRIVLLGRVQGVGCHAQVLESALQIGHLSGFVRNLESGEVEVRVKGPDWRVADFEKILKEGLPSPIRVDVARVDDISLEEVDQVGFVIRR